MKPKAIEPPTTTAVYLRVSSDSQEFASQKRAVDAFVKGRNIVAKTYSDKQSGKSLHRTDLDRLQTDIFNGVIKHVIFFSIDRFSRELVAGLVQIEQWAKMGIQLTFIQDGLHLDGGYMTDIALRLIVSIRLAMAEGERERLRTRVKLGIAHAKEHGTKSGKPCGRPPAASPETVLETLARYKGNKVKAAKKLGVSLGTIYNVLKRQGNAA